jgi:hypothetical protein
MRSLIMVPLLLGLAVSGGRAQGSESVLPIGIPLRMETVTGERLVGYVVATRADTVRLALLDGRALAMPVAALHSYAIRGTDRWQGARRGALVGGLIGASALGLTLWADFHATGDGPHIPVSIFVAPYAAGVTVLGAGVGALFARERWSRPVSLDVTPTRTGSLGIALRMPLP